METAKKYLCVLKALNFIEEKFEQQKLWNVNTGLFDTMKLACSEAENLIGSGQLSEPDRIKLETSYQNVSKILLQVNVLVPHKLFEE